MDNQKIIKALTEFSIKKPKIIKTSTNPYYNSSYADINTVLHSVEPILRECGILILQYNKCHDGKRFLSTQLIHIESGEMVESTIELLLPGPDMQKLGGAITYARRYALVTLLNLEQADDDGNFASTPNENKTSEAPKELATTKQVALLKSLMIGKKIDIPEFLKKYNFTKLEDLSKSFVSEKIKKLMEGK